MTDTPACTHQQVTLTEADLPLCCPRVPETLWNAHPRVYLPLHPGKTVKCPYCSTEYHLEPI